MNLLDNADKRNGRSRLSRRWAEPLGITRHNHRSDQYADFAVVGRAAGTCGQKIQVRKLLAAAGVCPRLAARPARRYEQYFISITTPASGVGETVISKNCYADGDKSRYTT